MCVTYKNESSHSNTFCVISPLMLFYSYLLLEYPLEYVHDISQLGRTGHDDVSQSRMETLTFILSELFPLDGFRCNFVSTP